MGLRQRRTNPHEGEGSLPDHVQRWHSLGSDPSDLCGAETASVDENQQAGVQCQAIRGRGTAMLQVPQIWAHKA